MADTRLAGPVVEEIAGEDLEAYRIVAIVDGVAEYADKDNVLHRNCIRGITVEAADLGETIKVQILGPLVNNAWTWTPKTSLYLGSNGQLTHTYPSTGYVHKIGVADSATKIFIVSEPEDLRNDQLNLTFGYGDASPEVIGTIPANKTIKKLELHILTAFDGSSPSLSVGYSGALDTLMTTTQNDPSMVATYENNPNVRYGVDRELLLSITPGSGAGAGAGLLVITFQR